jgi:hypothetical protein
MSTAETLKQERKTARLRRIRFAGREVTLPRSRLTRMALGGLFLLGGCFAFLPVLGVWMIPVGILILAVDLPLARRIKIWGQRKWNGFQNWRRKRS